ncbi:MAG: glycosyltransferase family 39 protein [Bacillota bacterium]|nr:glycosyltransferase family 39 protein [Bacillota bacterium]
MGHRKYTIILIEVISASFIIKLIFIFKYGNSINLASDDLNYIKSAVLLLKKGMFTYSSPNEPTVFIMPLFPYFLAGVFRVFGSGLVGLQAVRIIQAAFSCLTIYLIFLTAKYLFDLKIALLSSIFVAFYIPGIVTTGYILTETVFTTLLILLLYLSLKFSHHPTYPRFIILGLVWALATMMRPTIGLYPVLLFVYLLIRFRCKPVRLIKYGLVMALPFIIVMSPWWIRNYSEFGEFIPLSASAGNPMLQGTYINYIQTPENVTYYKLGRNAYETNKIEIDVAKKRMSEGFKNDFTGYLYWYTLGKTKYLWSGPFYWQRYFGISYKLVLAYHSVILLGFAGIFMLNRKKLLKLMLPLCIMLYFNIIHCFYMAFDRYAFPLIPILSILAACFWINVYNFIKGPGKKAEAVSSDAV